MTLPTDFTFSQSRLQDYLDCPRRFELRHLQKLAWPAVQSEPVLARERQMDLGERFHQLVHQHQVGLPAALLEQQLDDPALIAWWESYLAFAPHHLSGRRYPEFVLSGPYQDFRLIASMICWSANQAASSPSSTGKQANENLHAFHSRSGCKPAFTPCCWSKWAATSMKASRSNRIRCR